MNALYIAMVQISAMLSSDVSHRRAKIDNNINNNMFCFADDCCVDLFTWLLSVLGVLISAQRDSLLLIVGFVLLLLPGALCS